MNNYLPQGRKQITALGLYAALGTLAAFGKKQFLIALIIAHSCEYMFIARPLADEKCIDQTSALIHTLLYGFTWWKPIKQSK